MNFKSFRLLQDGTDHPKLGKNAEPSWHLSLAPGNLSGFEVCPARTPGCSFSCVGRGGLSQVFPSVMRSRIAKTKWFFEDRAGFLSQLDSELGHLSEHFRKAGRTCYVRLNAYSDIAWESMLPRHLAEFPALRFYDYTKLRSRAMAAASGAKAYVDPRTGAPVYRLCYSLSESVPTPSALSVVDSGGTLAVVFSDIKYVPSCGIVGPMPTQWMGRRVIDGDAHDNRYLDPRGCIVGLRLKGNKAERAHAKSTGFATPSVSFIISARSRAAAV